MKGILFRQEMIEAIRQNKKTVTRRLLNPQPFMERGVLRWQPKRNYPKNYRNGMHLPDINMTDNSDLAKLFSPYQVGEVVYIKETTCLECYGVITPQFACYKTNEDSGESIESDCDSAIWRSPMFMFARSARYFIQITDVRAERLQEINLADIYDEGCPLEKATALHDPLRGYELKGDAYEWYHDLWNSLNGKRYPWSTNPFVWRYEFSSTQYKGEE